MRPSVPNVQRCVVIAVVSSRSMHERPTIKTSRRVTKEFASRSYNFVGAPSVASPKGRFSTRWILICSFGQWGFSGHESVLPHPI